MTVSIDAGGCFSASGAILPMSPNEAPALWMSAKRPATTRTGTCSNVTCVFRRFFFWLFCPGDVSRWNEVKTCESHRCFPTQLSPTTSNWMTDDFVGEQDGCQSFTLCYLAGLAGGHLGKSEGDPSLTISECYQVVSNIARNYHYNCDYNLTIMADLFSKFHLSNHGENWTTMIPWSLWARSPMAQVLSEGQVLGWVGGGWTEGWLHLGTGQRRFCWAKGVE